MNTRRVLILLIVTISLGGCARFTTTQEERRYDDNGKLAGTITTRAGSFTFFDSKSALANFHATQTDKTQSAKVGTLNQETSGTNVVTIVETVVGAAVGAAVKAAKPVP